MSHPLRSCHQWSAGGVVPALLRRMRFSFALSPVNFVSLHTKCGEEWLECSACVVTEMSSLSFAIISVCFGFVFLLLKKELVGSVLERRA